MKVEPDPLVPDTYVRAHKRVLIYQTKWGPKARAWPKPTTKKPSPGTLWRRAEFGLVAAATKNMHALDYATAVELTKNTEYVPRDVLMRAMYGLLYEIHLTDGSVWNGWRMTVPNVQDVLEQLTSQPGALVTRGVTFWEVIDRGDDGKVLTMVAGVPEWATPSGGPSPPSSGANYGTREPTHPDPTLFTAESDNAVVPTKTAFPLFGFTFSTPGGSGFKLAMTGLALPVTTPWTAIAGFRMVNKPNGQPCYCGMYLRKAGNAKVISWGGGYRVSQFAIDLTRWNSPTSQNAGIFVQDNQHSMVPTPIWFRIVCTGTQYIFSFSQDGCVWVPCVTESITAWLPSLADKIGVVCSNASGDTTSITALTLFDWTVTTP